MSLPATTSSAPSRAAYTVRLVTRSFCGPSADSFQALYHRIQEALVQADVALTKKNIAMSEKDVVIERQEATLQQQAVTIEGLKAEVEALKTQARRAETLAKAVEGVRDIEDLELLKEGLKRGWL